MKQAQADQRSPWERAEDTETILAEGQAAIREALRVHKRLGHDVVVWKDDHVVWLTPEEIPDA